MDLVSWFRKILRRQAIVEELGNEENTRTGELDDKSSSKCRDGGGEDPNKEHFRLKKCSLKN